MKFKKLMLVTFILLAILTIGAASAADDTSDDLAVDEDGDSVKAPIDEVKEEDLSSPYSDDGFDPIVEDEIAIDSEDTVVDINTPDEGNFSITVSDGESSYDIVHEVNDDDRTKKYIEWNLNDLYITATGTYFLNAKFIFPSGTDETIFSNHQLLVTEGENDAEDGVIITVPNGDDVEYNLDEDMNATFASVSVSNELNGNITISLYMDEDEPVEYIFFNKDLDEIDNKTKDPDNEGFTIYNIALSDLNAFDDFLEYRYFEIAFISEDDEGDFNEIDCREYNIEIDGENDNIIRFWESDDEGMHGEGEEIDATFTNANILNKDVVVSIPKENVPEDADNEFTVIIPYEDIEITFKLDEILDGDNYIIRVNDLQLPEFKESFDILMILQFYKEGEAAYYAEWMDEDEPIHIYESPCIFDETSLLNDDDVITIQEIPEGVDEFTIIISKEGSDDIIKTFKFSDMDIDDEEPWVAFKLEDLGITEEGDYEITVKFSDDLNYTGSLNVNNNVDIRGPEEGTYTSVDERVVNFRISEKVKGYVIVYVNGTQVGENLNLSDLKFSTIPPEDGRQIILNNLNITESGEYTVKVELYSEADELLGDAEYNITVEVGESSVEIIEGSYPYGTEANDEIIEYTIGAPLSDGQYFNIYFNGEIAGIITANGIEFNDAFTVQMFDVKIFKPGNYDVNVTFFDGETETDITTGSFSINELTLSSDKEVYIYGSDSVIISFNMDVDDDDRLWAYYVYFWGPVGRDDSMVFNPYGGNQLKEDGMYNDGVVSFDIAWITDEEGNDHFRLDEGTNLLYVIYEGVDKDFGGFIEVNVIEAPEPVDPELTISVANIEESTDALVVITTNSTFTGSVSVEIVGVSNHTVNVINGTGNTTVSGLAADTYVAIAKFEATELFTASEKNTTFNVTAKVAPVVTPVATVISASPITTTYATSKNIVVTLKDANGNVLAGKDVIIVLNGVSKTVKTDDKGQATLAIATSLTPKVYNVTFTFEGDSTYAKSTGDVEVTVKKAKAKLKAKKKTFKAKKKSKKYSIVLKTDKGKALKKVKVRLKIKGKKFTAKTNSKGKATFKIKKLTKKGKYKAKVTFAGNTYYNKVTKKVKITVKK